jgi:hypothetical protein
VNDIKPAAVIVHDLAQDAAAILARPRDTPAS